VSELTPLPKVHRSDDDDADEPLRWRRALGAFALTVLSTFFVGAVAYVDAPFPSAEIAAAWRSGHPLQSALVALRFVARGWTYSVPLLTILLFHEFGHFLAARRHGVPASLPMFIPLPLPPLGTLGAVIRLPSRIRRRDALLDVGASGPLAGVLVALPITYIGLRLSQVRPTLAQGEWLEEGTSLLFFALKYLAKGPIPAGHEVVLHPTAMAGWVALLITMLNLIPYGQLDGGHVSYALLRAKSARLARAVLVALPLLGVAVGLFYGRLARLAAKNPWQLGTGYTQGLNWFVFALMVWALHRGDGATHPPTDPGPLSPARRVVALATLLLALALFMPVPLRSVTAP
jgi:membrane-associated protease RseP (regulator of RpoE activity)